MLSALAVPVPILAVPFTADLETGFSRSFAYTQYQIGNRVTLPDGTVGYTVFPLSELDFPLDFFTWYAELNADIADRVALRCRFTMNINEQTGIMRDSDWNSDEIKVIYSESDAFCKTFIYWDTDISCRIFRINFFSFSAGAGFTYQHMDFDVKNVVQADISSGLPGFTTVVPGLVLTYEAKYYLPYLVLYPRFDFGSGISILLKIAVSPYATGWERDDHILRSKLSLGKATGVAGLFMVDFTWRFWRWFYVSLECGVNAVFLEGNQNQAYYAVTPGPIARINSSMESTQVYLTLGVGFHFSMD